MQHITSPVGSRVSYDVYGSGPRLVLVHGSFSDHRTNWKFVKPFFEKKFTVYAVARRGRGETDATKGHTVEDESPDVSALIESIDEPVFLLGHSYGAQVALGAAANVPDRVRGLVLYEPPWPNVISAGTLARLEQLAEAGNWDELPTTFGASGGASGSDHGKLMIRLTKSLQIACNQALDLQFPPPNRRSKKIIDTHSLSPHGKGDRSIFAPHKPLAPGASDRVSAAVTAGTVNKGKAPRRRPWCDAKIDLLPFLTFFGWEEKLGAPEDSLASRRKAFAAEAPRRGGI